MVFTLSIDCASSFLIIDVTIAFSDFIIPRSLSLFITVYVDGNDKLADLMVKNAEQIKSVVLANTIETGKTAGFTKDWDINGEKVVLAVEKN